MNNSKNIGVINGKIIYKGLDTCISIENIRDYRLMTGMDPINLLEYLYNRQISEIRDSKIDQILS